MRSTIRKNDLLPTEEVHCTIACQTFLTEAYKYAVAHLPLSDAVLQNAEFLDIKTCANASFDHVLFFVDKFPTLKEKLEGHMDTLYDQFVGYQQVDASAKELSEFDRVDQVCTTWDICRLMLLQRNCLNLTTLIRCALPGTSAG